MDNEHGKLKLSLHNIEATSLIWYNLVLDKTKQRRLIAIYRQEIMQDIHLFTSQPKAKFYDELFSNLDLDCLETAVARTGRKGYLKAAMRCAFIVMKCEGFSQITDLMDYLENNRLIAYYCGFDITRELPSYWTFARFLRKLDNGLLKQIMQQLVLKLVKLGVVDTSFVGLDSTPVIANTKLNNQVSFAKNRFSKENQPKKRASQILCKHP